MKEDIRVEKTKRHNDLVKKSPKGPIPIGHQTETEFLDIGLIDGVSFNPPTRATATALKTLIEDVRQNGILQALTAIPSKGGRYLLADGHRRLACARELGIKRVLVTVHHISIELAVDVWKSINTTSRRVNAYEHMYAWYETDGAHRPPSATVHDINCCRKLFGGMDGVKLMLDRGLGPNVGKLINSVLTNFDRTTIVPPKPLVFLNWTVDHREQYVLMSICSTYKQLIPVAVLRKLEARVRNNKPCTLAELLDTGRHRTHEG